MDEGIRQVEYVSLEKIFLLQEQVAQRAMKEFSHWEFSKDCIELVINCQIIESQVAEMDRKKFEIVHTFLNDAISTLINSLKLSLYGCRSDAMMLLRAALEELAVLEAVIKRKAFNTADYELDHGFKKLRFDAFVKDKDVKEHWGRLSDLAHATLVRVLTNRFSLNGRSLPTVGLAHDMDRTRRSLIEVMRVSLYMVRILVIFYSDHRGAVSQAFFVKAGELETRYSAMQAATVTAAS